MKRCPSLEPADPLADLGQLLLECRLVVKIERATSKKPPRNYAVQTNHALSTTVSAALTGCVRSIRCVDCGTGAPLRARDEAAMLAPGAVSTFPWKSGLAARQLISQFPLLGGLARLMTSFEHFVYARSIKRPEQMAVRFIRGRN